MIRNCFAVFWFLLSSITLAAPSLETYGRLPAVELMRLSPSGSHYAFVAVVGEARRLGVLSAKGEPVFFTKLGDLKVRKLEWVGEDRLLLWSSTTYDRPLYLQRAYEFSSVINIDLKTRKISGIFEEIPKVANIVFGYAGTAHVAGNDYAYFSGITYKRELNQYVFGGDRRDLYQVDLATNETKLIAPGGEGASFRWAVNADGQIIAHSEYDRKAGIWRLYAGDNRAKLLREKSAPFNDIELIGRGRNSNTVWIVDSASGADVVEEVSVSDGKGEMLFEDRAPERYLFDPANGFALGAITMDEIGAAFFDARLQARINGTRKAFSNLQMQLISFSHNLDRLIVQTEGANDPGTYWLVDIATGRADPIGHPYPDIRDQDVGPMQMMTYKAGDGLNIHAVLTLPPGRAPKQLPLVVLPHGGPIGVSDGVGFNWWAQAYASAGYAVLQPNFRGSGGGGKDLIAAGYGQWGRKMQTDISDGVTALANQGVIDSTRVCIVGASYGGYAALAGVTLQQGIYRCAVSVAGPVDMPAFFHWTTVGQGRENETTRYWRAVTGADTQTDAVMKTISPIFFAAQAKVPILLIHGKDDTVVPIEQSESMASALRKENKVVEFIEMPGEDHWLSREETRVTMLKASVDFVLKHNPPN